MTLTRDIILLETLDHELKSELGVKTYNLPDMPYASVAPILFRLLPLTVLHQSCDISNVLLLNFSFNLS